MHIEPIIPDFKYVKIRRTGGILGVDQSLHVDGNLAATVDDRMTGTRRFELDAVSSQELMHALSKLVDRNPEPSTRTGADLFYYDIELSYGGKVYHFNTVELGADEALHGVSLAANRLIDHQHEPFHVMELHVEAPA